MTAVIASSLVLSLVAALLIARPWASDSRTAAKDVTTTTPSTSASGAGPTLSNRLVVGDVGEELTVQWANGGEVNIGQMGQPTGVRSMSVLAASEIIVPMNGGLGVGLVATVPNEFTGAVLRFTDQDGKVSEAPLKVIRDDWTFLAAAIGVATKGTAVLLAADGAELAHLEITDDALDGGGGLGGGRVVTTSATVVQGTVVQGTVVQEAVVEGTAVGGSATADTDPPTTDSSAG